jgi:hypothetical protein
MDDSTLVSFLSESYDQQLGWYEELSDLCQKTLSRLILSRGNVAVVMDNFNRKQKILDLIVEERNRISGPVLLWQERKKSVTVSEEASDLDALFARTASAIKKFLDNEEQLKTYLENVTHKVY